MSNRCNGCTYTKLKRNLDGNFLALRDKHNWTAIYELDKPPYLWQVEPTAYKGRPIRWYCSLMLVEHADDCNLYGKPIEVEYG